MWWRLFPETFNIFHLLGSTDTDMGLNLVSLFYLKLVISVLVMLALNSNC